MGALHSAVGRGGRVLLVDDEPFVANAIALYLGDEQTVTVVHSALDALARIADGESFDVILCDVRMPDISGIELHRTLTASFPAIAPRLVFITGGVSRPEDRAYLDAVPNECVDKPPDPFALRALVRRRVAEAREGLASSGGSSRVATTHVGAR